MHTPPPINTDAYAQEPEPYARKPFPWVFTLFGICLVAIIGAVLFPVFGYSGGFGSLCFSNIKQIGVSERLYEADYDERMTLAPKWMDSLHPYTKSDSLKPYTKSEDMFHDSVLPVTSGRDRAFGYGFNDRMANVKYDDIRSPERQVVFFDSSDLEKSAYGGPELIPDPGRHKNRDTKGMGDYMGFADTHVKWLDPKIVSF